MSRTVEPNNAKIYSNFVSLGYFCSIALELEEMGLRNCSYPFDWCISDYTGVEQAIFTRFEGFMEYENLYQYKEKKSLYRDTKYGITFVHDFDRYTSLEKQLPKVKEKYRRRIEKFYKNLEMPTICIRYISDERGKEELENIEKNYQSLLEFLQRFNKNNKLIFIANEGIQSDKIRIYNVKVDKGDKVSRNPIHQCKELYDTLNSMKFQKREENIKFYKIKQKRKNNIVNKGKINFNKILLKLTKKEYEHIRQI